MKTFLHLAACKDKIMVVFTDCPKPDIHIHFMTVISVVAKSTSDGK